MATTNTVVLPGSNPRRRLAGADRTPWNLSREQVLYTWQRGMTFAEVEAFARELGRIERQLDSEITAELARMRRGTIRYGTVRAILASAAAVLCYVAPVLF